MTALSTPPVVSPGGFASLYVRAIVGFGVWFAIGLAPFLGKVRIPGFTAVIEMYPVDLQAWLVPLSGIFMGMIGVTVEFASEAKIGRRTLQRWFISTVAVFVVSLIVLMFLYLRYVARVDQTVRRDDGTIGHVTWAIVTGARRVPAEVSPDCPCTAREAAATCVARSLDPTILSACFDDTGSATLQLAVVYLALTGSFAAAVGLLILERRRRASTGKRPAVAAPAGGPPPTGATPDQ